jgi:YVTN family beta-propeller protein
MSMQNREIKLLWRIRAATIVGLLVLPLGAYAERAYVSNEDGDTVTVIDTAKGEVTATIDVGKRPRGLKVSKDGSLLYVAVSGLPKCPPSVPDEECAKLKRDLQADGIAVIDATSLKLRELLKAGSDPERFDLSADGHLLFVTNEDAAQTSVLDARTGAIKTQISVGQEPEGVAVSPDGKWVLVTNESANAVSVIDAHSLKLLHAVPVGKRPRDVAFTPDSRTAYVTGEFDASLYRMAVPGGKPVERWVEFRKEARPMAVLMDAPRERLYVSTGRGGTVAVVSLAGKLVAEVPVGARPWGIAVSKDNRLLYTANGPSNDVSVVDLETLKVVKRIPVGKSPWAVALGPTPTARKQ